MRIIELCLEIAALCEKYEEKSWERSFKRFAEQLEHDDVKVVGRSIMSVYAGMGSFNDLAFNKGGDNDRLDNLRHMLFKEVLDGL